jgi:hypothetical protein
MKARLPKVLEVKPPRGLFVPFEAFLFCEVIP